ncbi:NAD(P)/FAD-dependent oxidoreductase [Streptomyces goshikiensis]|uniref:NAD(P)/FAD-dependent oxidoreductase n=1 Tax=Streptomyces goshikiensis TaxID=1942 RepID=UPI0038121F31
MDGDFFRRERPRTPQAVQPHSFLAPVRSVLRAETPDVYADLLARGAREYHDFDWFGEHPPHREGDEELVTLRTRRIVLEAALAAAVRREPAVEVRRGRRVDALAVRAGRPARVTGVRVGGETLRADLVIDAAGRRSPVPGRLVAAGCRPPVVYCHRTGLACLCRWYQPRAGGPRDPGRVQTGSASAFALAGVFPSDNDTFAVNLVLSTGDPTRGALTDPAVFEAAARRFPATAAWLGLDPEPRSAVLAMAGLVNAGDSLVHTNPTLGHAWTARALRPWFDAQVTADRGNERRLAGSAPPPDRRAAARAACAFEDPVVMRARAHVRHLLLSADEVERHVTAWLAARPEFAPRHDGPTREQWDALIPA